MTARLRKFLLDYAYPGNVRELSNIIYRISCLADDIADIRHLQERIRPDAVAPDRDDEPGGNDRSAEHAQRREENGQR